MTATRRDPSASNWHDAPTPAALWTEVRELLARCGRGLRGEIANQTESRDIGESQFSVLWACAHGPPRGLSQGEIAVISGVSPAHVSGLVEQLRAKGWLAGHRRPPDRRKQVWQLTTTGTETLRLLLADLADWAELLDQRLSIQRRDQLLEVLRQLLQLLAQSDPVAASPLRVVRVPDADPMASRKNNT